MYKLNFSDKSLSLKYIHLSLIMMIIIASKEDSHKWEKGDYLNVELFL